MSNPQLRRTRCTGRCPFPHVAERTRLMPMELLGRLKRLFDARVSFQLAAFTAILATPIAVQADNWSGVPTAILGLLLIPATGIALFLVALAFASKLHWALCVVASALFWPIAWYGFRFFAGATDLVSEGPSFPYYGAMIVLGTCVGAYGIIVFKCWRRYILTTTRRE